MSHAGAPGPWHDREETEMKDADWEAMTPFERELIDLLWRGVRALETLV